MVTPGPTKASAAIQTSSPRVIGVRSRVMARVVKSCVPAQRWGVLADCHVLADLDPAQIVQDGEVTDRRSLADREVPGDLDQDRAADADAACERCAKKSEQERAPGVGVVKRNAE